MGPRRDHRDHDDATASFDLRPGRARGMGRGRGHDAAFGWGGNPWGGNPWGDFPVGPGFRGGRRRGARVARGDVRYGILTLVAEQPMHGYQIIQELAERSGGVWRPSPGSIYPTLAALEDEGLIRAEKLEGKRVFHITEAGQAEVVATGDRSAPWDEAKAGASSSLVALRNEMFQLGAATMQVAQAGTKDQVERARDLLAGTRKKIYLLLAEDVPAPDPTDDAG